MGVNNASKKPERQTSKTPGEANIAAQSASVSSQSLQGSQKRRNHEDGEQSTSLAPNLTKAKKQGATAAAHPKKTPKSKKQQQQQQHQQQKRSGSESAANNLPSDAATHSEYQDSDVLLGRGRRYVKHPGNVFYQELIQDHAVSYNCTSSRRLKGDISAAVIKQVKEKGGSFRRYDEEDKTWQIVPDNYILEKTGHALRYRHRKDPGLVNSDDLAAPPSPSTGNINTKARNNANRSKPRGGESPTKKPRRSAKQGSKPTLTTLSSSKSAQSLTHSTEGNSSSSSTCHNETNTRTRVQALKTESVKPPSGIMGNFSSPALATMPFSFPLPAHQPSALDMLASQSSAQVAVNASSMMAFPGSVNSSFGHLFPNQAHSQQMLNLSHLMPGGLPGNLPSNPPQSNTSMASVYLQHHDLLQKQQQQSYQQQQQQQQQQQANVLQATNANQATSGLSQQQDATQQLLVSHYSHLMPSDLLPPRASPDLLRILGLSNTEQHARASNTSSSSQNKDDGKGNSNTNNNNNNNNDNAISNSTCATSTNAIAANDKTNKAYNNHTTNNEKLAGTNVDAASSNRVSMDGVPEDSTVGSNVNNVYSQLLLNLHLLEKLREQLGNGHNDDKKRNESFAHRTNKSQSVSLSCLMKSPIVYQLVTRVLDSMHKSQHELSAILNSLQMSQNEGQDDQNVVSSSKCGAKDGVNNISNENLAEHKNDSDRLYASNSFNGQPARVTQQSQGSTKSTKRCISSDVKLRAEISNLSKDDRSTSSSSSGESSEGFGN